MSIEVVELNLPTEEEEESSYETPKKRYLCFVGLLEVVFSIILTILCIISIRYFNVGFGWSFMYAIFCWSFLISGVALLANYWFRKKLLVKVCLSTGLLRLIICAIEIYDKTSLECYIYIDKPYMEFFCITTSEYWIVLVCNLIAYISTKYARDKEDGEESHELIQNLIEDFAGVLLAVCVVTYLPLIKMMPYDDAFILMLFMGFGYVLSMIWFFIFLNGSKKRFTWTFATCFAYGVIRILHGIIASILSQQGIIGDKRVFENSQDYYEVVNDEVYIRNYITQKEYVILLGILATIWILSVSSFLIVYKQWKDLPRSTELELLLKKKKKREAQWTE